LRFYQSVVALGTVTWGFNAPYIALSIILNLALAKGDFDGAQKTFIEKADVTPVFRSCVSNDGVLETRIEKPADHLDGRSSLHLSEFIVEIERYAALVLGKRSGAAETAT
jgi:poly-gamma-glutamate synthesis protein (capsule biosynthesis protein)